MTELTREEAQKLLEKAQQDGTAVKREAFGREYFEIIEPAEPTPFDR